MGVPPLPALKTFRQLSSGVWTWTELHGQGNRTCEWHGFVIRTAEGSLALVDPLPLPDVAIGELEAAGPPRDIFLTSDWHVRDTDLYRRRWGCRVRAHEQGVGRIETSVDETVRDGDFLWGSVRACHLPFVYCPEETALLVSSEPPVLIIGDALCGARSDIGIPDGELGIYRTRPIPDVLATAAMFGRLLEHPIGVIAFGHGKVITEDARGALDRFVARLTAPVTICDYDPSWPLTFEALRSRMTAGLGALAVRIEHVGSTSVPGLAAKPIIDLDVVVASRDDVPRTIEALDRLGYTHQGDLGIPGREAFNGPATVPGHHLYLCAADSAELRRHLAFRDYLRAHPEAAVGYARLKRELAQRHQGDRDAYTEGKTAFVQGILRTAGG
ncbi:MAG: GrpB family protein [Candidatus Coatesbacteria bacterium]